TQPATAVTQHGIGLPEVLDDALEVVSRYVQRAREKLAFLSTVRQKLARRRPASSRATIISRIALMRSPSKNMCSVRHSPIPSAPKLRATRASRGVSALARTLSVRTSSAQPSSCAYA